MSAEWNAFVDRFIEETFEASPPFAVFMGRHEFDGRLPDWSQDGLTREIERLRRARDDVEAYGPATLDAGERFERDYLRAVIDGELFWLETAEFPWRSPTYYGQALDPSVYLTRPYAPLPERMRAFVDWARAVPAATAQIRANLRTPLPDTYIEIGRRSFGGLADYLKSDVPGAFEAVEDAGLKEQFDRATGGAVDALRELDGWLEQQESEASDDFALGADTFRELLFATERVDLPLDELERIGREDLERNRAALEAACAEFAPGVEISECIRRAQAHNPEGGPVQAAEAQLDALESFVRQQDLVSIPGSARARVSEAPPHQRWNFAYIEIPGPYEEGLPAVYYIAPPDPDWSEEERSAYLPGVADLTFVTIHEVWPGHFLQFLHAHRCPSAVARTFIGYAFAEGWAHYAEELMWEAGFGGDDPEIRIGLLLNALLRNVRYLCAIGLHSGRMSVAEAETLFREAAYQDPGNARQQAARGTFDPGYLNYTLGKLMIRKLREDWRDQSPDGTLRDFHDRLLSYGGPPIPLIRRELLGEHPGPPL